MADYLIPENPDYMTAIRKLESTDPANAELFNTLFQRLIENTHAVKMEADGKSDSGHKHSPSDSGLGKNLTFTGAVTGTYNGEAGKTLLIPDRKGCRFVVGTSTAGWTAADCDYLCDGTDDQVEIHEAFKALPSTGGEIKFLDGTYMMSAPLSLYTKDNVTFSGSGFNTILKRSYSPPPSASFIRTGKNNIFQNFTIDNGKEEYGETETGFYPALHLLEGCKVLNCNVINSVGTLISSTSKCVIMNNIIKNSKSIGIMSEGDFVIIKNNYIENVAGGIIVKRFSSKEPGYCLVENNIVIVNPDLYVSSYTGFGDGILLLFFSSHPDELSDYWIVSSNIVINAFTYGILCRTNDVIICNNTVVCNTKATGIRINEDRCVVQGNLIANGLNTLYISGSNNLITDNMIWGKNYTNLGTGNTFANNKYN
jgi:hypothetical protein